MRRVKEYFILGAILSLCIVGARLQSTAILYAMLGLICLFVVLVAFGKINEATYPYAVFIIGLSLLYQTTLMSDQLVGSDIHAEYCFYLYSLTQGWDRTIDHAYNSCIGAVIIAPFITNVLHINGMWIYKVIYPFLFAFVPVLLFCIFKKQFADKIAFLSAFFFLAVPVWSLEMIALPRQMLGELMLVVCAYLIIISNWRLRVRVPLIGICAILGAMFHYVMGPTILLYLGIGAIVLLFFKRRSFPVKWLAVVTGVMLVVGIGWYGWTASGVPLRSLTNIVERQIVKIQNILPDSLPQKEIPDEEGGMKEGGGGTVVYPPSWTNPKGNIIEQQTPLIRTAFGLDFGDVSALGRAFRIFQFVTQILLAIGCLYLFVNRKKYSPEYLGFAVAAVLLIAVCILVPRFLTIINASRVYHLSLLFMAPALVLGGKFIFRNLRILAVCLIIPYFLFTSGILFEATKHEDVSIADVPYSIALSHDRVDVAAVFTDNDAAVRDWAVENRCEPLFIDINGQVLFSERTMRWQWRHLYGTDVSTMEEGLIQIPEDTSTLPDKYYIFLREWSVQNELVTFKPNWFKPKGVTTGMRVSVPFSSIGLDKTIEQSVILYRQGDAIIYGNED